MSILVGCKSWTRLFLYFSLFLVTNYFFTGYAQTS